MAAFKNLKPIHLYLIGVVCFIASRLVHDWKIPVLHYIFSVLGFIFFIMAIRKYLKK